MVLLAAELVAKTCVDIGLEALWYLIVVPIVLENPVYGEKPVTVTKIS